MHRNDKWSCADIQYVRQCIPVLLAKADLGCTVRACTLYMKPRELHVSTEAEENHSYSSSLLFVVNVENTGFWKALDSSFTICILPMLLMQQAPLMPHICCCWGKETWLWPATQEGLWSCHSAQVALSISLGKQNIHILFIVNFLVDFYFFQIH